ncbi:high-temperature-induced dauer-formation protein-domain-containing protein [Cantharellus anzutake]|uniref:high-temperature-induced dauer-formation protein-domain-containing protein n=1 Tax=Cantharellus anzutake TaxID=1750568 RepID=UPI0019032532|nr:high-temperature-induced dauer-formation protein-domain-containing protein [Cantharellus anzutake]KAF8328817.1 high-temperature-induced dauer-formation protein-domain-containing protein [Cantharellus anzutake]
MFPFPKLSSSFGLIGNDPKLAFRTQPGGITKLAEVRNIAETDDAYWSQYVQLFDSATDVYTLITSQDIRRALVEAPENVKTLINVITHRLFNLISDHTFPSPPATLASGITNLSPISPWAQKERDPTKEVLNCLRVLGRIIPVVFDYEEAFEEELFWMQKPVPGLSSSDVDVSSRSSEPQFVIDDEDEGERSSQPTLPEDPQSIQPKKQLQPCLAERLFSSTIDLMFCCGFTLPTSIQVDHHKINYVIWDKGIGSTTAVGSSGQLESNKSEVLRFLLILLSKTMYHAPATVLTLPNRYASHFVHKTPRRLVLSILCSLLNTSMNGEASAGWTGMVDKMPYNHLIMAKKADEGRAGLVGLCLDVLCVLLDYQVGDAADSGGANAPGERGTPTTQSNAFRYFLAKLHRPTDFDFVLNGVLLTLETDLSSASNLLPGSTRPVPYILETFIFLWKMIELNKKFRAHLLESEKLLDLIAYLLCFCLENKDKPQHHGLCRALSYVVQSLSAEMRFAMRLQDVMPARIPIPSKWQALGSAGDFFITSIYSIVATTSGSLNSLYPALIIAISNVAPYFQNLTVISATKLIHLFTAFSNPMFLLADDSHPRLVFFMLEALNGILFHQLASNPNVVYAILRSHKIFEEMGTFTLVKGLREIRRVQELKEERARQSARKQKNAAANSDTNAAEDTKDSLLLSNEGMGEVTSVTGRGSGETITQVPTSDSRDSLPRRSSSEARDLTAMSEKTRGKMRERSISIDLLDPELERIAAAGIGKNGFVPTQEWVTSWQQGLPLDPILLTISELLPRITEIAGSGSRHASSRRVLDYLKSVTLEGILPPAPSLNPRRFQWSDASMVWLSSLIWGEVYVRGSNVLGVWNGRNVRLFGVRHTPTPRGVGEAVQNVVGGMFGSGSSNDQIPATGTPLQRLNPSR